MATSLPACIAAADIHGWGELALHELRQRVERESRIPGFAAKALHFAHAGESDEYDAIGDRLASVVPYRGAVPLQTVLGARRDAAQAQREASGKRSAFEPMAREQMLLRHRLIELPEGRTRYEIIGRYLEVKRLTDDGAVVDGPWSFPLGAAPRALLGIARDRDAAALVTQSYKIDLRGIGWLSVAHLVELGEFPPMQQIREQLAYEVKPAYFYCFVSHRWLTPVHPDPEGRQARLVGWQMLAYLCEAIRVARARGLDTPRKFISHIGVAVGPAGSELAESLIVNLLRPALDETGLAQAGHEANGIEHLTRDRGVAVAETDGKLALLGTTLSARPMLAALLARVMLWYDYSCLPQPPRAGDEERLFADGLEQLSLCQMLSRTGILLDEPEDYLSRAWCTLEALTADFGGGAYDVLVGAARPTAPAGEVELHFVNLLEDRPHLVWRAVLDTELFRVQSPERCMQRLGLHVTEPADLVILYHRLAKLPAPVKVHADDSELITGVLPIPVRGGHAFVPQTSGVTEVDDAEPSQTFTFDCSSAMRVDPTASRTEPMIAPLSRSEPEGARTCHIAVVAGCEGEAMLVANWLLAKRGELESLLRVQTTSLTWTASDIAPVGHLAVGDLGTAGIAAGTWVVVSTSTQRRHGTVSGAIACAIEAAGLQRVEIALDVRENNLRVFPLKKRASSETLERYSILVIPKQRLRAASRPGGAFRATLWRDIV